MEASTFDTLKLGDSQGARTKCVVKKAEKFLDDLQDHVPTYRMRGRKRAAYLIINIIEFIDKNMKRTGAEQDHKDLLDIFGQMGFTGKDYLNLDHDGIYKAVDDFLKSDYLENVDCCIVVVMSHGGQKNGPYILSSDCKRIWLNDLNVKFTNSRCERLIRIPKIFLYQCCRYGAGDDTINTGAHIKREGHVPRDIGTWSDMLVCWSTLAGNASVRLHNGTVFIQAICKAWSQYACGYHVEDLMKIAQKYISEYFSEYISLYDQITYTENLGFKRCFLNPGLHE